MDNKAAAAVAAAEEGIQQAPAAAVAVEAAWPTAAVVGWVVEVVVPWFLLLSTRTQHQESKFPRGQPFSSEISHRPLLTIIATQSPQVRGICPQTSIRWCGG